MEKLFKNKPKQKIEGAGLCLRPQHFKTILKKAPKVPWFEILIDNYLNPCRQQEYYLDQIAEKYPFVFHGVSLSLASPEKLDQSYLKLLKKYVKKYSPAWHSDHLCWSHFKSHYFHDLLPFPYTEEALKLIAGKIHIIQNELEIPFLVENVSSYVQFKSSQMSELEFLSSLCQLSSCKSLLDVNNLYINCTNHSYNLHEQIKKAIELPVVQIHLAGHQSFENYCLDDHGGPVSEDVWEVYKKVTRSIGKIPTNIEWDNHIPQFATLFDEMKKVENIWKN